MKRVVKPSKPKAKSNPSIPIGIEDAPTDSGTFDHIRELLQRHGPMTSGDLIRATKRTPAAVYTALGTMRKKGELETIKDDGLNKNKLVAA